MKLCTSQYRKAESFLCFPCLHYIILYKSEFVNSYLWILSDGRGKLRPNFRFSHVWKFDMLSSPEASDKNSLSIHRHSVGGKRMARRGETYSNERMDGGRPVCLNIVKTEASNTGLFTVKATLKSKQKKKNTTERFTSPQYLQQRSSRHSHIWRKAGWPRLKELSRNPRTHVITVMYIAIWFRRLVSTQYPESTARL